MRRLLPSVLLLVCAVASAFPIDFSRVGYMWGDRPIPDYPVYAVLTSEGEEADATSRIQKILDEMPSGNTLLLKEGVYRICGSLILDRDSVVIKGEGDGTVLFAAGRKQRTLLTIGKQTERKVGAHSHITDRFTPVGQMWVRVADPSLFSEGDRVAICMRPSKAWIKELKMDRIAQNSNGNVKQWTTSFYVQRWERTVTKVKGNKVWLDNPVVMELDARYMDYATLEHVSWDRIVGSGVENLRMVSEYDSTVVVVQPSGKFKGLKYRADENHCWSAVDVLAAEHCWVRNVSSAHFAYALVNMKVGAKNITVRDCCSTDPISELKGSRRYAYHISGGQLCLVENCRAEHDRHGFVTGARVPGPNVFLDCDMVHAYSDIGPHHRWASGVLYDNCRTDGALNVQDRAGYGTGHGWAGVSFVFWNCVAETIICQSPWINGQNWCIGCVGKKVAGRRYDDSLVRPDGTWISKGIPVEPASVYRTQFAARKERISE